MTLLAGAYACAPGVLLSLPTSEKRAIQTGDCPLAKVCEVVALHQRVG